MNHPNLKALAAGLLSLWAVSASATSLARVDVSGLTYRLVDLNTNDGIAPWIAFTAPANSQSSSTLNAQQRLGFTVSENVTSEGGNWLQAPSAQSAALADGSGRVELSSGNISASSQGKVQNMTDPANLQHLNEDQFRYIGQNVESTSSSFGGRLYWTMSANTALIVEGFVGINTLADATPLLGTALEDASRASFRNVTQGSYAMADFYVYGRVGDDIVTSSGGDSAWIDLRAESHLSPGLVTAGTGERFGNSRGQSFAIRFDNATSLAKMGVLGAQASAITYLEMDPLRFVPESPIPEPGTAALTALGLVGLAVLRKRRCAEPKHPSYRG